MSQNQVLPTKKQKEVLNYIDQFITTHGYSPSFREIKTGLGYNSLATVSLHVENLIKRGHLIKRDHNARSLELSNKPEKASISSNQVKPGEEKWLVDKIEHYFRTLESSSSFENNKLDELYVLIGALKVLGLNAAAQSFLPRLNNLKKRAKISF